ncbi:MAG: AsmA family, partial [Armatimonadetes bacterium]|nr:AsmA family [Armatimonadota bacterium]
MRIPGSRRARLIVFALTLLLAAGIWRVSRLYGTYVQQSIAPTLLAQLRTALKRDIRVDSLEVDEPGLLVAKGVHVARGPSFKEGELLSADRLEVRYDPLLLSWSALMARGSGYDTRARVRATGVRVPQGRSPGNREFFSARSAETELNFGAALQGKADQVVASINHVDVRGAFLQLIRTADGRWNYEQVLKFPKAKRPTEFRGEFRILSGAVELYDHRSG